MSMLRFIAWSRAATVDHHQAEAEPDLKPQRGLLKATDDDSAYWGPKIKQSRATGQAETNNLLIMHRNSKEKT